MYKMIIELIDKVIEEHKSIPSTENVTDRDKHFFIQGLEMTKQQINWVKDLEKEEVPYETFEEIVHYFAEILEPEEFKEIVSTVQFEDAE